MALVFLTARPYHHLMDKNNIPTVAISYLAALQETLDVPGCCVAWNLSAAQMREGCSYVNVAVLDMRGTELASLTVDRRPYGGLGHHAQLSTMSASSTERALLLARALPALVAVLETMERRQMLHPEAV